MATSTVQESGVEQEDEEQLARLSPMPTVTISGTARDVFTNASLSEEQNGSSFAVRLESVRVEGTLLRNHQKPTGELTPEHEDGEWAGSRPVDYRVVDESDSKTNVVNDQFTDRGGNVYVPSEGIDEDEVVVWFNGMSGQFLGRTLDFNGRPFAGYSDNGYLVKGLFQVASEWRGANSSRRRELVRDGLAPRVARPPVLRSDVEGEEITIYLGRYNGGNGYEVFTFLTEDLEGRSPLELEQSERRELALDMVFHEEADDVIEENDISLNLYHGVGWEDVPDNAQDTDFNIEGAMKTQTPEQEATSQVDDFVQQVARAIEGPEFTPEEAFDGGLEGLMKQKGITADVADVRQKVYAEAAHLDGDDPSLFM